jgi:hypothetical protein
MTTDMINGIQTPGMNAKIGHAREARAEKPAAAGDLGGILSENLPAVNAVFDAEELRRRTQLAELVRKMLRDVELQEEKANEVAGEAQPEGGKKAGEMAVDGPAVPTIALAVPPMV